MTASDQDHNPENTPATEEVNPNRVSGVAKGLYILCGIIAISWILLVAALFVIPIMVLGGFCFSV